MAKAIAEIWPSAVHLLCIFHLYKNFYEHVRKHFGKKSEQWIAIASMWWKLCLNSDSSLQETFYYDWDTLANYILLHVGIESKEREKLITWLNKMKDKADRWAATFTYQHTTYGIHSTQRAEAIHSSIQLFSSKHSSIVDLVKDLEDMSANQYCLMYVYQLWRSLEL
jgi:hypothetical protein